MHFDVGVALIILQAYVVVRPVLLDQRHLQDQGFQLGADNNPVNIGDILYQVARFQIRVRAVQLVVVEIGTHPVAQVVGLAHIDDLPGLSFIR
jgi:hypothetical protein